MKTRNIILLATMVVELIGVLNCTREQVYAIVNDFAFDLLSLTGANLDIQAIISSIAEV